MKCPWVHLDHAHKDGCTDPNTKGECTSKNKYDEQLELWKAIPKDVSSYENNDERNKKWIEILNTPPPHETIE